VIHGLFNLEAQPHYSNRKTYSRHCYQPKEENANVKQNESTLLYSGMHKVSSKRWNKRVRKREHLRMDVATAVVTHTPVVTVTEADSAHEQRDVGADPGRG
jgi:hypothetical protein